jgi:ribosomal protein S18 acetylase RimI-like enzyme
VKFKIDHIDKLHVSDKEISALLSKVYVQAGFTSVERAQKIFDPLTVRKRGTLFVSRDEPNNVFAGMVIVVPPGSTAVVRAKENECEMHLLGVMPSYRGNGLGRELVNKAIEYAEENSWSKMILWTQKSMKEAQALYESSGFVNTGEMLTNGIEFLVYERACT